jgi:hypothetical protein
MRTMNPVILPLLLAGLSAGLLPSAAGAQAFEGTLTFAVHSKDGTRSIMEWVKGGETRYDMLAATGGAVQGTLIVDAKAKTPTVIMPARKMYMTVPHDPSLPRARSGPASDVKWTRTGKSETVAGIKCDVIHGVGTEAGKPKEADLCVARGIGFGSGSTGGGPFSEALTEYANLQLAPGEGIIKMTSIEGGTSQVDLELTQVSRRTLAPADFQPPADYSKYERGAAAPNLPPTMRQ